MKARLLLCAATVIGGCLMAGEGRKKSDFAIAHFSMRVPAGYVCKDVSPQMADFYVVKVSKKASKKGGMKMYFGNAPSFPAFKWSVKAQDVAEQDRKHTWYAFDESSGHMEGLIQFAGLTYSHSSFSPFSQIHYFAEKADATEAKEFAEMVKSIRVVKAHLE